MRVELFSAFFPPTLVKTTAGRPSTGSARSRLGGYVKITGHEPGRRAAPSSTAERRARAYYRRKPHLEADRRDPRRAWNEPAARLRRVRRRAACAADARRGEHRLDRTSRRQVQTLTSGTSSTRRGRLPGLRTPARRTTRSSRSTGVRPPTPACCGRSGRPLPGNADRTLPGARAPISWSSAGPHGGASRSIRAT